MRRLAAALTLCALASACGSDPSVGGTTTPAPTPAPPDRVHAAQHWIDAGPYHYVMTFTQSTTASGVGGLAAQENGRLNTHIHFTATGDVVAGGHARAVLTIEGWSAPVTIVESGCSGYFAAGTGSFSNDADALTAVRSAVPSMDGATVGLAWRDAGPERRDGTLTEHYTAPETVAALSGGGATASPEPGLTLDSGGADLYLGTNGSPVEFHQHISLRDDLSASTLMNGSSGTIAVDVTTDTTFGPTATGDISPPAVASAVALVDPSASPAADSAAEFTRRLGMVGVGGGSC